MVPQTEDSTIFYGIPSSLDIAPYACVETIK